MATSTYTWTLTAFQQHGNLWLKWSTDAPFRAQQGQISVYKGTGWPSNPQDNRKTWTWDNYDNSPWDTTLPWGSDWYCAWIAQASPNESYVYVVQLVTTGASNQKSTVSE
jgi:hypothetical protein